MYSKNGVDYDDGDDIDGDDVDGDVLDGGDVDGVKNQMVMLLMVSRTRLIEVPWRML